MEDKKDLRKVIEGLNLPAEIKQDLERDYLGANPESPNELKTKSMVRLSSKDGRKAAIILWENDTVSIIATNKKGNAHISSADSPDIYYIAQKQYIDAGLDMDYAEEDGKEIGIR